MYQIRRFSPSTGPMGTSCSYHQTADELHTSLDYFKRRRPDGDYRAFKLVEVEVVPETVYVVKEKS